MAKDHQKKKELGRFNGSSSQTRAFVYLNPVKRREQFIMG